MTDSPYVLKPSRRQSRPRLRWAMAVTVLVTSLMAIVSLLMEHGFHRPPAPMWLLRVMQLLAVAAFAADAVTRLVLAPNRWGFARRCWSDLGLLTGALVAAAVVLVLSPGRAGLSPRLAMVAKVYILANLFVRAIRLNIRAVGSAVHPARLLLASFLMLILLGTGLLMLPKATPDGHRALYFEDALFTSTSATCVTGLIVKDTGTDFTLFAQVVILCLIQLGGLGIMIFGSLLVMLVGGGVGVRHAAVMGEMISQDQIGLIGRMVKFILLTTFLIEAVGAACLLGLWQGAPHAGFKAVFHSVSAFCNAGFSLQSDSFTGYRDTWQIMLAAPLLIIFGGLGFPVLYDLARNVPPSLRYLFRLRRRVRGIPRPRLTLHTKIVLAASAALLLIGTVGLVLVEPKPGPTADRIGHAKQEEGAAAWAKLNDWQRMETGQRFRQAWFHSVSARTAGFNTVNMDQLSGAGQLWMVLLMMIGGSPASTAGGLKTVTFAIMVLLIWSVLRRRQHVEVFGRSLAHDMVRRAVTLAVLFVALVCACTLALSIAQGPTARFMDVLFESASACGTVGLSTGQTGRLTLPGKYVIIAAMFAGRVGPLTLLMGLVRVRKPARYSYPAENVVIG